ncbi:unnamed protein product [Porites lobata]|uniref:THAP-type domain-containing protein n=1 Tax=Porites lobata TaxID=104759 RepID=A0ABN8NK20_9CNID|nr:unnamed protein product [Porites lobata]
MASSSKQKNSSHKCCAAVLCNNHSDNRPELIFHNFPSGRKSWKNWPRTAHSSAVLNILVRRTDRKSLTGKRRDLVKNAVPSIFPWSVGNDEASERNRKREIEPIDQLWLFLTRVRLGLFDLAHRFSVSVSTVSDVFITWANYLYIMLGSLPLWPSRDKIKQNLPDSFNGRYENVSGDISCLDSKHFTSTFLYSMSPLAYTIVAILSGLAARTSSSLSKIDPVS